MAALGHDTVRDGVGRPASPLQVPGAWREGDRAAVGGDAGLVAPRASQKDRSLSGEQWAFLEGLPLCHETDGHFFVHANYAPNRPLSDKDRQTALWLPIDPPPGPHYAGKTAVVGHTAQIGGPVLNLGHLVCIDTGCGFGGLLTGFDVGSGRIWQVDELGRPAG